MIVRINATIDCSGDKSGLCLYWNGRHVSSIFKTRARLKAIKPEILDLVYDDYEVEGLDIRLAYDRETGDSTTMTLMIRDHGLELTVPLGEDEPAEVGLNRLRAMIDAERPVLNQWPIDRGDW